MENTSTPTVSAEVKAVISEVVASQVAGTKWYMSKTLWTNVIAAVAIASQMKLGFVIAPEYQMLALTIINSIIRKFTNGPVVW